MNFSKSVEPVVRLIEKYSDLPMSLADACLIGMTETLADPIVLTTGKDSDSIDAIAAS